MKMRICFVGMESYPLLNRKLSEIGHGGEGVQQMLLARAFSERGYDVHMIAPDYGQLDGEVLENIKIWKTYHPTAGIPALRYFYPRISSILQALSKADADIYYQSCAGMLTGITAWFCKRAGRRFLYRVASDTDCIPGEQLIRFWRDRKLYEYGLRRSDLVLAQSVRQQKMLKHNYNVDSEVVGILADTSESVTEISQRNMDVLWVNNIRPIKKPERVLELSKKMGNHSFHVVGGACDGNDSLYKQLHDTSKNIPNLKWHGFLPYSLARSMFSQTKLFLSTSDSEGFPNTYLQAWMAGTPVITFFDPDGVIKREGLGVVVSSVAEANTAIASLINNMDKWTAISRRCRAYSRAHHGPNIVDRYEALMAGLFDPNGSP